MDLSKGRSDGVDFMCHGGQKNPAQFQHIILIIWLIDLKGLF